MPHCSLEFSRIGLPVAVHSQWNRQLTQCALRIFTNRESLDDFLAAIPHSEGEWLATYARVLEKTDGATGVWEIRGDTALSLTNFLVTLSEKIEVGERVLNKPDLIGFWEPPPTRISGTGMMMWFHPDNDYQVAIAHAKEQATDIIRGLSWLDPRRQKKLLGQIAHWKMYERSDDAVQRISGIIAEILCKASLAAKINNARNMQAKANQN